MASQPLVTPDAVALQHARRHSESAWGTGYQPAAKTPPKGDAAYTNIGSHERVPPSAAKVAMHEAGRKGVRPPGGPKGPNAPIPAKPPRGR